MISRHTGILELVFEKGRIEVSSLAEMMGVSEVTIRKDLSMLEEKGLLKREHGYAVTENSDDISKRLAFNYLVKKRIAAEAASLVEEGETVMIESGSSCALLAEELAAKMHDITIITNSSYIASHIRQYPGTKIVLLGGDYQCESQVVVGPITKKCIEDLYVDKLFVGTDGFSEKTGFTGKNPMRVETVRAMAENANKVIILTESRKFGERGVTAQFKPGEVAVVITDSKAPEGLLGLLKQNNVDVRVVPAE